MAAEGSPAVEAVLFDLDGTLIDHRAAGRAALAAAVDDWGGSGVLPEDVEATWFALEDRHMAAYLAGDVSFQEQRRARLRGFLPAIGVAVPDDARADALFARYLARYEQSWRAYDDVEPCLRALAAVVPPLRLAVLSNGDQLQQERKLELTGLDEWLPAVLTPERVGASKPAASAFRSACATLGSRPSATVFVGDDVRVDALGAAAAGLRAVWIDRHGRDVPAGVVAIHSLADLAQTLRL